MFAVHIPEIKFGCLEYRQFSHKYDVRNKDSDVRNMNNDVRNRDSDARNTDSDVPNKDKILVHVPDITV